MNVEVNLSLGEIHLFCQTSDRHSAVRLEQAQEPDRSGKRTHHQNPPHAKGMRTGTKKTQTAHNRSIETESVMRDDSVGCDGEAAVKRCGRSIGFVSKAPVDRPVKYYGLS